MTTVRIGRSYTFDSTHMLPNHMGKCKNLHGHTYLVEVWLKGEVKNELGASDDGMLIDFGDLDKIVKPLVDGLDHSVLYGPGFETFVIPTRKVVFDMQTTAENLSVFLATLIAAKVPKNVKLVGVKINETPKNYAEYIKEVNNV